ncbi:hypothetical protein D3C75_968090 [compost metagenome]
MVSLHILDNVVVAADEDPVISGSLDFQTFDIPVMAEDLQSAFCRSKALSGEIKHRLLTSIGNNVLARAGCTAIVPLYSYR